MAAQQEQEMSLFELASAKIDEAKSSLAHAKELMVEAGDFLEQDLSNARQRKADIEALIVETTKALDKVHFASTIKLNVGGKIYQTTLDTLRKDPDSMLWAMFSGRFGLKADEKDGTYFIDRDGKLFRYILNFLRNGELLCPEDRMVRKELLAEAKFYQVQGVISQLEEKPSPIESTLIIQDEKHHSALLSWLPSNATGSLLYRATTDGFMPLDFHRCCDNKGPTLVIVQSAQHIFGGFTSKSWETSDDPDFEKHKIDSKCFLFTLVNPAETEPIRMQPKPGGGIKCTNIFGPSFGDIDGYDLKLLLSAYKDKYAGVDFLGSGFRCNMPRACRYCQRDERGKYRMDQVCECESVYFTGKHFFEISELEVFKVEF